MAGYISDEDNEAFARKVRRALLVDDQPQPHMATVIFKMKNLGWISDFQRDSKELPPGKAAAYDRRRNLLLLSEDTFCGANEGIPTHRFTVAHELAHVVRQHDGLRFRASVLARELSRDTRTKPLLTIDFDEIEANRLAAAILMPHHLSRMAYGVSPQFMADHFGVSQKAAQIRYPVLQKLERIKSGTYRPLPASVQAFLTAKEKFEVDPCGNCGRRTVLKQGAIFKCVKCGHTKPTSPPAS